MPVGVTTGLCHKIDGHKAYRNCGYMCVTEIEQTQGWHQQALVTLLCSLKSNRHKAGTSRCWSHFCAH